MCRLLHNRLGPILAVAVFFVVVLLLFRDLISLLLLCSLSYSYVATAVPLAQQKLILTLVSTSRTIGMAIGPFVNMALVKVSFDLHIGTLMTIPVNPNNAAGLVMATGEVFLLGVMLVFLKEPTPLPPADNNQMKHHRTSSTSSSNQWMEIAKAMCCIDLFLPPFIMTVVWVNFQTYVIIIRRMSLFMLV